MEAQQKTLVKDTESAQMRVLEGRGAMEKDADHPTRSPL